MEKFLSKIGVNGKLRKNFVAILIVAFCGSIIYGLPYFRFDYYDAYIETYKLTNIQMGVFGSVFGVFGMISYLFGGFIADRVSTRILVTVSMIGTGLGGFLHLLPLPYAALVCLYAFWGFTSLFAFWPACVKAVRMMSDPTDQGKAFGIFEGGRGICAALVAVIAVIVFRVGASQLDDALGMRYIIIFYSVLTTAFGIFAFLTMKDGEKISSERIEFKDIKTVIKMPAVWIIAIVTFCNYVYCLSLYYFVPYATSLLGATVAFGATLAAIKRYLSPISNVGGGFIGDKVGTGNLLFISFLAMALGTGAILLLPFNGTVVVLAIFTGLYLMNYLFFNVNYSLTWAMMEEGAIPEKFSGTAAGIVSTIGYLPDVFLSLLAGSLMDKYTGATGFRYFFLFLIGILLLGAVFTLVWKRYLVKNKVKSN